MQLNEFQALCKTTALYGEEVDKLLAPIEAYIPEHNVAYISLEKVRILLNLCYAVLGLAGEAGEVANKMKKVIRDDRDPHTLVKEVEGTMWYVNAVLQELGVEADDAAQELVDTLKSRSERGVIKGDGDDR